MLKIHDPLKFFIAFILTIIAVFGVASYLQNSQTYLAVANDPSLLLAQLRPPGGINPPAPPVIDPNNCNAVQPGATQAIAMANLLNGLSVNGRQITMGMNACLNAARTRLQPCRPPSTFWPAQNRDCTVIALQLPNGSWFATNTNNCVARCDVLPPPPANPQVPPVGPAPVVGKCSRTVYGAGTCSPTNDGVDCTGADDCAATCNGNQCLRGGRASLNMAGRVLCASNVQCGGQNPAPSN